MLYTYESENLIYRILPPESAGQILNFYYINRELFEPFEPDKPSNFYTLEYQEAMCRLEYESFLRGKSARYWIYRKSQPNIIIGCVYFSNIMKGAFNSCNIAYKIHKEHLKLGYATEAVRFLTAVGGRDWGLHRIEAYIHPQNKASIALAQKCGFEYDGTVADYVLMRNVWTDHLRYTLINR
jgi:ribosomal-protein-alanine N-acetyltransferase